MNPIAIHKPQFVNRLSRLIFFSLLLALGFGINRATADACLSAPKPLVFVMVKGKNGFDAEVADLLEDAIMGRLNQNGIRYTRIKELQTMLQQDVWRQLIGTAQDASLVQEVARQLGTEWFYFIQLQGRRIVGTPRTIEARLQNNRTGETIRATSRELSVNENEMMETVFQVIREQAVNLNCDLRGSQVKPVVPSLRLTLSKESVLPGETFLSYASLRDLSDNSLQANKQILFNHEPPSSALSSVGEWPTDANGLASYPWRVDNYSAAKGSVQASFIPRANVVAATSPKRYYRLIRPGGNLRARSGRASLLPNQSDTVQFVLTNNGQPAAGKTLNFSASGGTLATASAVTDAQGQVQVAYTAPAQPAVTEVSVSTAVTAAASSGLRAAAPAETPLQESLNYVVDAGVAMKLNLTDTLVASPASISVDLDRNGAALSGIPVDFQLQGSGSLNATRVNTDSAGRAETLFLAPQDPGASTIIVTVTLDGQTLTRTQSIRYVALPGICQPAVGDVYCYTPIEITMNSGAYYPITLNARGEVLFRIDNGSACHASNNPQQEPCGTVWRAGITHDLPNRFVPRGMADDGTVAGNQYEGILSHPAVVPSGNASSIRLATSTLGNATSSGIDKHVETISPSGRVTYSSSEGGYFFGNLGYCEATQFGSFYCQRRQYYETRGPNWGEGTLIRSDALPDSGSSFLIEDDADAGGRVGSTQAYKSNSTFSMKDFAAGTEGRGNLEADNQGTVLYYGVSDSSLGLDPPSSNIPTGWQPYALGPQGHVLLCSPPASNGLREVRLLNLRTGQLGPVTSQALQFTHRGHTINVNISCSLSSSRDWLDGNGRLFAEASSQTNTNVRGVVLTPSGQAMP